MRILMLSSTLPRFPGDMQANFVGEQAAAWLDARPEDEIIILAPHDAGIARVEREGRVEIRRFGYSWPAGTQKLAYPAILPNIRRNPLLALQVPGFVFSQYRAAKQLCRTRGIDLVYAHWVVPQGLVACALKRALKIPFVLQTHSSDLTVLSKLGSLGRRLARNLLNACDVFFCVNSNQLTYANSLLGAAEREEFASKAHCLPMGVEAFAPPKSQYGKTAEVATIARLSRKKGLDHLINAAEALAQSNCMPEIMIAGDGEDRSDLEAMVHKSNVTFTGFLAGPKKADFLANAQRFAFPAKAAGDDVEGLPVALLEALLRGKPVLASRDTNIELLPEWPLLKERVVFVSDPTDVDLLTNKIRELLALDPAAASETSAIMSGYRWVQLIRRYIKPVLAAHDRL